MGVGGSLLKIYVRYEKKKTLTTNIIPVSSTLCTSYRVLTSPDEASTLQDARVDSVCN